MVVVKQTCSNCVFGYEWYSQPTVLGKYAAGNILLSFAIIMAGASISKMLLVFRHMGLCVYGARHSFAIKEILLFQQFCITGNHIKLT